MPSAMDGLVLVVHQPLQQTATHAQSHRVLLCRSLLDILQTRSSRRLRMENANVSRLRCVTKVSRTFSKWSKLELSFPWMRPIRLPILLDSFAFYSHPNCVCDAYFNRDVSWATRLWRPGA